MNATYHYRFESFLYPAHVTRIEIEAGEADSLFDADIISWPKIVENRSCSMSTMTLSTVGITLAKCYLMVTVMTTTVLVHTSCLPTGPLTN